MGLFLAQANNDNYRPGETITASGGRALFSGFMPAEKDAPRIFIPLPKNPNIGKTITVTMPSNSTVFVYYYNGVEQVAYADAVISVVDVTNEGILISLAKSNGTLFTPSVAPCCISVMFRYDLTISFAS